MTETLFAGGPVLTMDPARPRAEAILVADGTIAAVGDLASVRAAASPRAEAFDLAGRTLMPAFQDAHAHPSYAGVVMQRCDLHDLPGPAAVLDRVAAFAAAHPGTPWITGGGWEMDHFPGGIPHKGALDAVVPDRPVALMNRDVHGVWVNSRALELAGITAATPDPWDGRIERDAAGDPVGTLHEGAVALVERVIPAPSVDTIAAGILAAQDRLISLGITAWQDAWVTPDRHDAYVHLSSTGRLRAFVAGALWWDRHRGLDQVPELVARREATPPGPYRAATVKIMVDGVCENFTAAMLDPFLTAAGDPTDNHGIEFVPPGDLAAIVTALDAAGFQVHFHTIGDRAARSALDAVAAARTANGASGLRHHLAHLQVLHRDDIPRFAALDVAATVQPLWAHHSAYQDVLTIPFLGPERAAAQYPIGSLDAGGARLAFGSDWPVSPPDPFPIVGVASTRVHPGRPSAPPLGPRQAIPVMAALRAATLGSAWVNRLDATAGPLAVGLQPDLVVVAGDPTEEPAACRVEITLRHGAPLG